MERLCKAFLLLLLGFSAAAQEPVSPKVSMPLIAIGAHHRPTSVTIESLVITDQKMPVKGASLLRGADLPLELGIMIDASKSQADAYLDEILKAMKQFVDSALRNPQDRVFFLEFQTTSRATEWLNKEQSQAMTVKVGTGGGTALYDALAMACKQRMGPRDWHKPTRRILVLISDGEDNLSHFTRDQAASEALTSGTVIFTINTASSTVSLKGGEIMENLAKLTGGESFSQISRNDMPKVFAGIQELMDSMYYLSYVPPDTSKGTVHEVQVKPAPKQKLELSYPIKYPWNPYGGSGN